MQHFLSFIYIAFHHILKQKCFIIYHLTNVFIGYFASASKILILLHPEKSVLAKALYVVSAIDYFVVVFVIFTIFQIAEWVNLDDYSSEFILQNNNTVPLFECYKLGLIVDDKFRLIGPNFKFLTIIFQNLQNLTPHIIFYVTNIS